MGILMKGIISSTKTRLEIINKKINDWMKLNIQDYNATQWGTIKKHPTENKFILIINDDSRNPLKRLTVSEKSNRVKIDEKEWFPSDDGN